MEAKAVLAQGWSSLPVDLVNSVADRLLATNDLDYYMDLRAVCHHWRSSTADPRSNPHEPRFRPTQWVMLDEVKHYASRDDDGSRDFVNAATGRFLRRSLPLLRHYDLVTSTTGGLLVLTTAAARDPAPPSKHASVRVLNPFTGSSIDFAAPMPAAAPWRFTADAVGSSSSTLFLASILPNSHNKVYWAEPQSASFSVESHTKCPASSLPLIAAAKCIGNLALFLGVRCVALDVGKFKGIQANCAYFPMADRFLAFAIYKVDIEAGAEEQEPEFVELAVTYARPYWRFHLGATPFTLTQVLCNYTMDIARHPPSWELASHAFSFFDMALAPYIHLFREDEDEEEEEDDDDDEE